MRAPADDGGLPAKYVAGFFAATLGVVMLVTYHPFLYHEPRRFLHQASPVLAGGATGAAATAPQAAGGSGAGLPSAAEKASVPTSEPAKPEPAKAVPATAAPQPLSPACVAWCSRFGGTWCSSAVVDGACGYPFPSNAVQGMIEGGFSASAAIRALLATGGKAPADVPRAIKWALEQNGKQRGFDEYNATREVVAFDHLDLDGYALVWGSNHKASSPQDCGLRCKAWEPRPPAFFPCNVWVFCGKPKCFAPAALPPGDMTGQCWLKHQDDPANPQVNMKGAYTAEYLRRHPNAPAEVDWSAGVVVRAGTPVRTDTWSARANW